MLKIRLIPLLLLKDNVLVKSINFSKYQSIGNPFEEVERFNQWKVDELIYLNISENKNISSVRPDAKGHIESNKFQLLKNINRRCFMPLTWGGGIKNIDDVRQALLEGADKVAINTEAFNNPDLIKKSVVNFGSQAIIISIDVKKINNEYMVFINGGKINTNCNLYDWIKEINNLEPGEILIQSIDEDGSSLGYDLELLSILKRKAKIPYIACSGVGDYNDFIEGCNSGASAVAAANIWHYKDNVDYHARKILKSAGINVRK